VVVLWNVAFNAFYSKVVRLASEEVLLNLNRAKCLPILLYGNEAFPLLSRKKLRSLLTISMRVLSASKPGWKQASSDLTRAKLRLCDLDLRSNWPKCGLMMFQCCHLKSGSSILQGTLASLLMVSCQCLHIVFQCLHLDITVAISHLGILRRVWNF